VRKICDIAASQKEVNPPNNNNNNNAEAYSTE
jgi:hypothetical protein